MGASQAISLLANLAPMMLSLTQIIQQQRALGHDLTDADVDALVGPANAAKLRLQMAIHNATMAATVPGNAAV